MTRANHASASGIGTLLSILLVLAGTSAPTTARAHTLSPSTVISRITADDMKEAVGVVSAATDPKLVRLLVIRVGPQWQEADEQLRRSVAEKWLHLWKDAMPNGIVAVIDDRVEKSLVGYDVTGAATLHALSDE